MASVMPLPVRDGKPLPFLRMIPVGIRNPVESWTRQFYQEPLIVYRGFGRVIAFVMDPEFVRTVFLGSEEGCAKNPFYRRILGRATGDGILVAEGHPWREQRRATAPLFQPERLAGYAPAMARAALALAQSWRSEPSGSVRDASKDMARVSFDMIQATVLLGKDAMDYERVRRAVGDFMSDVSWRITFAVLGLPRWLPHPGLLRSRRASRDLRSIAEELIAARGPEAAEDDDLLGALARAAPSEDRKREAQTILVDNAVTFLIAGYETLAQALTWALCAFARAPQWQDRLASEVEDAAGDRPLTFEHIDRLPLLQQAFQEAMRLYAPAPTLIRVAREPIRFGDIELPAGTTIAVPIFVIHRHERFWAQPELFDPTRFAPERKAERHRYAYLPFGAGARGCVAGSYAMLAATIVLAALLREVRFELAEDAEPMPVALITLHAKSGMPLRVFPRSRA